MVQESKKSFYKKFLYLPFPVESCLEERMCETLNAEIAIGTINSIVDAVGYLTWTFFARRVEANPSFYGAATSKDKDVESFLLSVVQNAIEKLVERGCVEAVKTDDELDKVVRPTILGKTASNYYLQYRTPKQMLFGVTAARKIIMTELHVEPPKAIRPSCKIEMTSFTRPTRVDELSVAWILYALSSTHEFDELPVRHNEEHLNAGLSKDLIWGADTLGLIGEVSSGDRNNLDIMADPHTK
jgi:activating signal cointegrator complex subunit 3